MKKILEILIAILAMGGSVKADLFTLTLESFPPASFPTVSKIIDLPDIISDASILDEQWVIANRAALFALEPEGWDLLQLVDIGNILYYPDCNGCLPGGLIIQGPDHWSGRKLGITVFVPPWNDPEIVALFGYELNPEAIQWGGGASYQIQFHTDEWVERGGHEIGESPDNYGTISGLMGGIWSQAPVPEWGRFTAVRTGDFDDDNDVDGADFLQWQRGEVSNPLSQSDLGDWRANFGNVATSVTAASTTVPEPSTLALLILTVGLYSIRRTINVRQS